MSKMAASPDMMWQFARYVKYDYAKNGVNDVKVFVDAKVFLLNGQRLLSIYKSKLQFKLVHTWSYFGHQKRI